ncbi:MAG: dehypoxanthine futalosine cyclase [Acidobacteria bacterium]|nr:dehypoxanthine futalosine cyclase [Acidobacteriota bacterium]
MNQATRQKRDLEAAGRTALGEERLSDDVARRLLEAPALTELGLAADAMRRRLHPEPVVTYIIDRNINYTNVCVAKCNFCAFYRLPGDAGGYLLSPEELDAKARETVALGGTGVLMQGGLHPELGIEFYERLLADLKRRHSLHLHAFSPPEIVHFAAVSKLSIREVLTRLQRAGLDSIPGGGAEILVDRVREAYNAHKSTSAQWLEVMETAHQAGIPTTATMMFGGLEDLDDRITHLRLLRELQDRTGGFTAFIGWTYQPENTELGGRATSAADYLRTLAVSRLYLDNFANIQASWVTMGVKTGQVALSFGANDMGSIMIEENVVRAAGATNQLDQTNMERVIRDAGFTPLQRDTLYRPTAA